MRAQLYYVLRRTISQEKRNRLKRRIAHIRTRFAPLYRARHGTFGAEDLRDELASRLPADTEIVMVHCSLNDLQPTYTGDVRDLLDALIHLCGPNRTLAMPAFVFEAFQGGSASAISQRTLFDVRRQHSRAVVGPCTSRWLIANPSPLQAHRRLAPGLGQFCSLILGLPAPCRC